MNLHQNKPPTWLVHIPGHPWVLGQATGTLDHETHHGPDSGEATTFPHIVLSASHRGSYIRMAHFVGTPEMESRNCLGLVSWVRVPGLWMATAPRPKLGSGRVLTKVVALVESFPRPCRTLQGNVEKRSIPDF